MYVSYLLMKNFYIEFQVFTDLKVVPIVELDIEYNSYALDFYNHGIAAAIRKDNNLKQGEDFTMLQDFMLVLLSIRTSLAELEPFSEDDDIVKTFHVVTEEFMSKFSKAYSTRN